MKTLVISIVVMALATGAGAGRAWLAAKAGGELFEPNNPMAIGVQGESPIVVVNGDTYEFGTLQRGSKMKHDFILKNVSDEMVEIWVGESSCTCTVASLGGEAPDESAGGDTTERRPLKPGETTAVTLEWEGLAPNPKFMQTADIFTSFPQQKNLRLTVRGYVQNMVHIRPESIQMNNVSVEEGAVGATTVYSALEAFPKVLETEFMVADTKEFFEIDWQVVTEKVNEKQKSARRLVVTAKPGLPIGTVTQRLRLKMDMGGENTLYVPITAKVESELSIIGGRDYAAKFGLLRWGVVDRDEGRETTLYVLAKGEQREQVKLEVDEMEPADAFDIEIQPVKNREAKTWTIPITVRLNKDVKTVTRLGGADSSYGMVRLRTNHPVAKTIQFKVQFAVN